MSRESRNEGKAAPLTLSYRAAELFEQVSEQKLLEQASKQEWLENKEEFCLLALDVGWRITSHYWKTYMNVKVNPLGE